jgi:hypothetical protein
MCLPKPHQAHSCRRQARRVDALERRVRLLRAAPSSLPAGWPPTPPCAARAHLQAHAPRVRPPRTQQCRHAEQQHAERAKRERY